MSDTTIIINATDIASDVFAKVTEAMKTAKSATVEFGDAAKDAKGHTDSFFESIGTAGDRIKEGFENPLQAAKGAAIEFVEGIGPMGVALVGAVTAAAAAGLALWELGEQAAAAGGKINDVGEKTGVSAPMVDKYGKAFLIAGSDVDVFSNSMFMLQRGIGDGSQKTADGLQKIGLSVEQLKAAGPDHYMELIAQGFANTEDPAAKASAAMDLFNRQGREILPTLNKLADAMKETSDIEPWTDEQAREAEHFEMQMASLKVHVGALAEAFGRELIPAMTWLTTNGIPAFKWAVEATLNLTGLPQVIHLVGTELGYVRAGLEAFGLVSTEIPKVTGDAKKGVDDWHESLTRMQIAVPTLSEAMATSTTAVREMKEEHSRLAEETRKAAAEAAAAEKEYEKQGAAWTNLNSIGESYLDTVNQLDPQLVAQIEHYIEAGAKVSDLATAYTDDLTPAQIDAIEKMVKANQKYAESWEKTQADIDRTWDQALLAEGQNNQRGLALQLAKLQAQEQNEKDAAAKKITDETQLQAMLAAIDAKYDGLRAAATTANADKVAAETAEIWNEFYALQESRSGTATDREIANVKKWYDDKVIKAREAGIVDQAYYDALDVLAQAKMHEVYLSHDKFYQDTKKLLDDLTNGEGGWVDTFSKLLVHTGSFKDALTGVWELLKGDTLNIFADLLSRFIHGFLDAMLQAVVEYVEKMVIKFAILKTLTSIFSFGIFSGGGVAGGAGGDTVDTFSNGGVVYAAEGWPQPIGTDTVPAMLTPGERVLSVQDTQAFERAGGLNALRHGGGGDSSTLLAQLAAHGEQLAKIANAMKLQNLLLPRQIKAALA